MTSAPAAVSGGPARPHLTRWWPPVAGLVAGAVTIGVAELAAALLVRTGRSGGTPSPVVAVGAAFIDRTPPWLKNLAVATFGTQDKQVLLGGIAVVLALAAAAAGILAARHRVAGLLVVVLLAAVAGAAVLSRPRAVILDVLPTLLGAAAGLWSLNALLDRARTDAVDAGRRAFVRQAVALAVLAAAAGAVSQVVQAGSRAARASRERLRLPAPTGTTPSATQRADLRLRGLSPMVTSPADFYRIDTALVVPQVDAGQWRLRVHGMVQEQVELDLPALLA